MSSIPVKNYRSVILSVDSDRRARVIRELEVEHAKRLLDYLTPLKDEYPDLYESALQNYQSLIS